MAVAEEVVLRQAPPLAPPPAQVTSVAEPARLGRDDVQTVFPPGDGAVTGTRVGEDVGTRPEVVFRLAVKPVVVGPLPPPRPLEGGRREGATVVLAMETPSGPRRLVQVGLAPCP